MDTKTDPKQVEAGNFLSLQNSVFDEGGLLKKRNGFGAITSLPNSSFTYLTTLNDNLTAVGTSIAAYSSGSKTWVSKGSLQPMEVKTLPLIRNNYNQTQSDSAVAPNGLVCTVYTENTGSSVQYRYAIADSNTGQNIIAPSAIPVSSGVVTGSARVFVLANNFIIVFTNVISATSHLQYVAISILNPTTVTTNADIASAYVSATTLSWDGVVANNNLYIAYNSTTGSQNVRITYLSSTLVVATPAIFAGSKATIMSVCADITIPASPVIYANFYDLSATNGHTIIVDKNLNTIHAAVTTIASGTILNLTSAAQNGVCTIFYEVSNNYSYDSAIPTHFIDALTVMPAGTVTSPYVVVRSVGLASKAFIVNGVIFFLSSYKSPFQPTYFLINGSTSTAAAPIVVGKLAYENGGGYLTLGLPSVTLTNGNIAQVSYLYRDLIEPLATLSNSLQTTTGGIYSQTGINLGTFTIGTTGIDTAEIAGNLNISGGFLWSYDGYLPVEQNFFLWPDSIEVTGSTNGGSITAQQYYYQIVHSWSDNQGNQYRSAPSIPVTVTNTGSTSSNTLSIPTLRLTYKIANPIKIEVYRWSTANPNYYQVSGDPGQVNPVQAPLLNVTTSDSVTFVDTWDDQSIVGNNLIYTTGGVVEDVNAPATNILTLFDTRLWLVDAEDPNKLWYSKQVIEATPVEMSDLFTFYVAPTTAAQGSTGPITALAPMDDKLIIFKENAIYYINGSGPDNTGANNQYSQPIYITATVGCSNQQSIVFMPGGLLFQSEKGIWQLGRDLSTQYLGAPVEKFNASTVGSAVNVPKTNEVRFTLNTGQMLMEDYYYSQWGTFVGAPAISSCIFQGYHTFINSTGGVFQETPGIYLDGSNPVLMSFLTGHIKLAGVSGYQRLWEIQLLGTYFSPHLLNFELGYNFGPISEQALITPINQTGNYGSDDLFGQTTPYGGPGDLEQWRIQPSTELCQAFQVSLTEIYDPSYGMPAGAGFNLSAMTCVVGVNRGYRPVKATETVGTSS